MKLILRYLLLSLLLSLVAKMADATEATRPRVGLVLGGGGARGAAHIGVLEVLQRLKVPVDCVAGTSMGALVAGAWVAGMPPTTMRQAMAQADWNDMFQDNPEYSEMSQRHRNISRAYLPGSESGVKAEGVQYQSAVVTGQKIKLFINQLVRANQEERPIESLPLPLSIIATDIGSGERVVFRDGSLTKAMRASMAVPGLLAPVDHQERKLVDGGLVDNLPVAEVRERCQADVVIAVNVGSPLLNANEVGSLLTVSAQMVNILTEQNVSRSLASLKAQDIYIKPDLDGITAGDFGRNAEAADRGRQAAEALASRLAQLAVSPERYAAWQRGIEVTQKTSPHIDEIEIIGLRRVNPLAVARHLHVKPGETLRPSVVNPDLMRIYGDGYYESVDYTLLRERDRNILRVTPTEKAWGPDYLRFGMNLYADSNQGSSFGVRLGYHKTWLNDLGGELLVTGEVGSNSRLGGNFYQPIDPAQRYFVDLTVGAEQRRLNLYENNHRFAQYRVFERSAFASIGHQLGVLGTLRLGWLHREIDSTLDIGLPLFPNFEERIAGARVSLDIDQFDRMHFATRGWAANLSYFESPQDSYGKASLDLRGAYALGATVLTGRVAYVAATRGELPLFDAGSLGGFQNMTAFAYNQLLGDDVRYAGVRAERIVGRLPLGLRGDMRLGVSFEAARIGRPYTERTADGLLDSTAVYFGGETPFGPIYFGYGRSTSGASNLFLSVGTR